MFKCKHFVPMSQMQYIKAEHSYWCEGFEETCGVIVTYTGFCRDCNAMVRLTEHIRNRALYEFMDRQKAEPK